MGAIYPSLGKVDSTAPSSTPLSRGALLRHASFVRAVCVNALARICAGGDQRWSSLLRPECKITSFFGGAPAVLQVVVSLAKAVQRGRSREFEQARAWI